MKKILLTLILTIGCSSAFAYPTYVFKCRTDPEINSFGAQDDAAAIAKVTSTGLFKNDNSTDYKKGCGALSNVKFLFFKDTFRNIFSRPLIYDVLPNN